MEYKTTNINKRLLKLELNIDCDIRFEHDNGYIVNHTLKKICGPYKNIFNAVDDMIKVCLRINQRTNAIELITHKDSYTIQYDIPEYTHVSKNGNETKRLYNTDDQHLFIMQSGIYCIENKELDLMYVGETIVSFYKRWTDHCKKPSTKKLKRLIEHPNTKFRIIEILPKDKYLTEHRESYYIDLYKSTTLYQVFGGNYRDNRKN